MAHNGYLLYFATVLLVTLVLAGFFFGYVVALFMIFGLYFYLRYKSRTHPSIEPFKLQQVGPATGGPDTELMFLMHGWPDDARIWDKFTDHFRKSYICVSYTMPGYNGDVEGFYWGYDLDEMVDCIALSLQDALTRNSKRRCILASHDWGCVLAQKLQQKHPGLIQKMIMLDVQIDAARVNWKTIWIIGFAYQFWLVLAFLVSSIPVVGLPTGDAMTLSLASAQGAPLCETPEDIRRTGASMNNLYFYLLKELLWHKWFGEAQPQKSQEGADLTGALLSSYRPHAPDVPTLFLWSVNLFHHHGFEEELRARPDCDAIKLEKVGHWFVYRNADLVNPKVEQWLRTGRKAGPYTNPVTGHSG